MKLKYSFYLLVVCTLFAQASEKSSIEPKKESRNFLHLLLRTAQSNKPQTVGSDITQELSKLSKQLRWPENQLTATDWLVYAATDGDISSMEKALAGGADINHVSALRFQGDERFLGQPFSTNALGGALYHEAPEEAVLYLINKGANVNKWTGIPIANAMNKIKSASPLLLAINENQPEFVEALIQEGADVNYKFPDAKTEGDYATALSFAVYQFEDRTPIIKMLLRAGADTSGIMPGIGNYKNHLALLNKEPEAKRAAAQPQPTTEQLELMGPMPQPKMPKQKRYTRELPRKKSAKETAIN